jgi:hypothetical protein
MNGILKYDLKYADGCVYKYEIPIDDIVEVGDGFVQTKTHGRIKYPKDECASSKAALSPMVD